MQSHVGGVVEADARQVACMAGWWRVTVGSKRLCLGRIDDAVLGCAGRLTAAAGWTLSLGSMIRRVIALEGTGVCVAAHLVSGLLASLSLLSLFLLLPDLLDLVELLLGQGSFCVSVCVFSLSSQTPRRHHALRPKKTSCPCHLLRSIPSRSPVFSPLCPARY